MGARGGLQWPYGEVLSLLVERLLERFGSDLVSVVVYGSVARGEARRDSDVDLLIVLKGMPKGVFKRQELFMEVEEKLGENLDRLEELGYHVEFSPVIKTPEEARVFSPLYLDMVEDAVILFDRDGFFDGVLRRLRGRLQELGAERVRLGKAWYWRLKRDYSFGDVIEI
ncbi:MAG: nucleotidyltransferase domain-containing protein [Candidatus Freyarchaeota archaeon]|nr:nucleotidyltransferase domain-containing protein [Candidatus Jordarchaeia archaeon]